MEDAVSYKYFFLKLFIICVNITAGNKILYVPVGWEEWLFVDECSKLALQLLHQLTLRFLGGMEELSYNHISMMLTQ